MKKSICQRYRVMVNIEIYRHVFVVAVQRDCHTPRVYTERSQVPDGTWRSECARNNIVS